MSSIVKRLPQVRGRIEENSPLAPRTWLKVGGPAEVLFTPADEEDLMDFLAACPGDVPTTIIGAASNLIIRDGGIPGVVIRFGRAFADISIAGATLTAGAGASCVAVSETAKKAGIGGFEFLCGIPGFIGGALRMNAGAYGSDIAKILVHADAVDRAGEKHQAPAHDLQLSYRHCGAPADWIFTRATFRGMPDETSKIEARMQEIRTKRESTQPVKEATAGSTFKNPPGMKAWELIEKAGCSDMRVGGAHLSSLHKNFMINDGNASASDCETLGEAIRKKVQEKIGVSLEWEVRIVGVAK